MWSGGGQGETIPRAPKSLNNISSTFFNTVHLLPKDIRFEHRSAIGGGTGGRMGLGPHTFISGGPWPPHL